MCPKLLRVKLFVPALDRRWSCRRRKAVDLLHSETCHLFSGGIIVVDSKAYKPAAHSFDIPNVLQRLCSRLGRSARCPTKGISWWSKWLIYCQELVKQKLRLSLTKTRRLLVVQLLCGAIFTLGCTHTLTQAEVCSVLRHNRWMKLLECACFKWVSSFFGVWSDPMQLVYAGCLSYTMMRTAKSGGAAPHTSL